MATKPVAAPRPNNSRTRARALTVEANKAGVGKYSYFHGVGEGFMGPNAYNELAGINQVYCTTRAQCQQYGKEDLYDALVAAGVPVKAHNELTKPQVIDLYLKNLKMIQAMLRGIEGSASGIKGSFPSEATNPSMYYKSPRDFTPKGDDGDDPRYASDGRLSKSDWQTLVQDIASGDKVRATEDKKTILKKISTKMGLLKERYLTIDHVGLQMTNAQGRMFKVDYDPIEDEATWTPIVGYSWAEIPTAMKLLENGSFPKIHSIDHSGLPLLSQLGVQHRLMVARTRDGRIVQVRCSKKSPSGGEELSNCRLNRNGKPIYHWAPFDPTLTMTDSPMAGNRFLIPGLGMVTYDQIMNMPTDKIIQALLAIKMLDSAKSTPSWENKLKELGFEFDPLTGMPKTTGAKRTAINAFAGKNGMSMMGRSLRSSSRLPEWFRVAEEKLYQDLADGSVGESALGKKNGPGKSPNGKSYLKKQCGVKNPKRCGLDSLAPGVCVPDESMCYDTTMGLRYRNPASAKAQEIRLAIKSLGADYDDFQKATETQLTDKEIDAILRDNKYVYSQFGRLQRRKTTV